MLRLRSCRDDTTTATTTIRGSAVKLRWIISRQWWSLWRALMILPTVSVAEFLVDITPAIHALHERTRRQMEFAEQHMANRRARRMAVREAAQAARAAKAHARERGGTI
jgi:hypothetical protein